MTTEVKDSVHLKKKIGLVRGISIVIGMLLSSEPFRAWIDHVKLFLHFLLSVMGEVSAAEA